MRTRVLLLCRRMLEDGSERARRKPMHVQVTHLDDAESPTAHLSHFVLHAALDNVDHLIATTPDVYLRVVDNFNEKRGYAFCTGGESKMFIYGHGILIQMM